MGSYHECPVAPSAPGPYYGVTVKVSHGDYEGVPVLKLEGDFDSFETDDVRRGFDKVLRDGSPSVIVDLGDMTFANSTTIASFIAAQRNAQKVGGTLVLAAPREFIKKTLITLGLNKVFPIADSLPEARERIDG